MYPFLWHYYYVSPKLVWLLFILANPNPDAPTHHRQSFRIPYGPVFGQLSVPSQWTYFNWTGFSSNTHAKSLSRLGFVPAISSANCFQRLAGSIFLPLNWLMSSQFQVTHCKTVSYSHSLVSSQSPFYAPVTLWKSLLLSCSQCPHNVHLGTGLLFYFLSELNEPDIRQMFRNPGWVTYEWPDGWQTQ